MCLVGIVCWGCCSVWCIWIGWVWLVCGSWIGSGVVWWLVRGFCLKCSGLVVGFCFCCVGSCTSSEVSWLDESRLVLFCCTMNEVRRFCVSVC